MNAEVSALFLYKLAAAYPEQDILLLWDRAPWHQGTEIDAVLEAHPQLEILYLPTAAPDLNPQDHVWKSARIAVSHRTKRN
jgi:transposase